MMAEIVGSFQEPQPTQTSAGVSLIGKPAACQKVRNRLLSGFVLDALEAQAEGGLRRTWRIEADDRR